MSAAVDRVNWVMRMHNCKIERVLDVIFEQVSIDVKEREKLSTADDGVLFLVDDERAEKRLFVVSKISICENSNDRVPIDEVKFRCTREAKGDLIVAERGGDVIRITRRWNAQTATCDYFVDDQPATPWQISNAALSTLFFE